MALTSSRRPRSVLILGPSTDVEDIRGELGAERFEVTVAHSMMSVAARLRASPIDAVVVSPDAPVSWIDELLEAIGLIRPGVLVLAVRERNAVEHVGWQASGVGVLRQPLLPNALARSVNAVLALRQT